MDNITGLGPIPPADFGRSLIQLHGGKAAALEATDPATSGYNSARHHAAVKAALEAEHPRTHHGGPPVAPQSMRQEDVPPGVWQQSHTETGTACPLSPAEQARANR